MSKLDKIARQIKAAKKAYEKAVEEHNKLRLATGRAYKAVNDAAKVVGELRTQLAVEAEGSPPDYALYI